MYALVSARGGPKLQQSNLSRVLRQLGVLILLGVILGSSDGLHGSQCRNKQPGTRCGSMMENQCGQMGMLASHGC